MAEWSQEHHDGSGLTQRCRNSKLELLDVESLLYDHISKHVDHNVGVIAGNSIHQDVWFLRNGMPKVYKYLNYRMMDVSSFKVMLREAVPGIEYTDKKECHTAMADIKESMDEMKHYLKQLGVAE